MTSFEFDDDNEGIEELDYRMDHEKDLETKIAELKKKHEEEIRYRAERKEWEIAKKARDKILIDAFDYAMNLISDKSVPINPYEGGNVKSFLKKKASFGDHIEFSARGNRMKYSIKKVISGVAYNSRTATKIINDGLCFHLLESHKFSTDFMSDCTDCRLCATKSGELFCVYGIRGGVEECLSVIGKYTDFSGMRLDTFCQLLILVPLTKPQAIQWLGILGYSEEEASLKVAEPEMKRDATNLRIPPNLMKQIDDAAKAAGMSRNEWIMRSAEKSLKSGSIED